MLFNIKIQYTIQSIYEGKTGEFHMKVNNKKTSFISVQTKHLLT